MKGKLLLLLLCALLYSAVHAQSSKQRDYYQITVYHFKDTAQENLIDDYLQHALVPALHSMNIKTVGVFKALSNDTAADKMMYVLMPVHSIKDIADITAKLAANATYNTAGARYLNAPYNAAPYTRMENILLQAFFMAPQLQVPQLKSAHKDRVYELRSYEGATEKLHASKVKMFNTGNEVGIFKNLNFNAVFYAEVLAGSHMPNLMYMTTFENMADRETHWKAFNEDSTFKKLLTMPEYQHNVSKADIIFLRPTDYSDI
ncbi:NIPSNAP family containing protein [Ilyomonas limi]|uniref:NIPSNAP family containing protein n=1 Tax=Ilyomonas limi TaxID=2575867 RepID=A0A4U3KWC1_9BACT|nr:NIPSNAP family protein [Ilyomonas limi]TKK66672.1 NIPSNAP family containing protein [Ilyomonas limi]